MVFQDGGGYIPDDGGLRGPVVLDNLIHQKEIPVVIGIFINPGILPALKPDTQQNRYNRSYEYDALSDRYPRFLIEELIPEIAKGYNLSKDPNDWAIAGQSSGGIAAFNAAWNFPDQFSRVLSFVGSYTNLRGGHNFPTLIRKTEPKPLRVFLQDGSNDSNIYAGSWWISNQDLAASLEFAGYDFKFVTGTEGHNMKHGGAILPDAIRWLWQDHGTPIAKPKGKDERFVLQSFVDPDSTWEEVSRNHKFTEGPAVNRNGDVYFTDIPNNKIWRIEHASGKATIFKENSGGANGLMFGFDGRLYACQNGRKRIVSYNPDGSEKVIADNVTSNDLCVTSKGEIYFTDPSNKKVWHINLHGKLKAVITEGLEFPNGVVLSPDESLLIVSDSRNKWTWSYQIQPDGTVSHGEPFYRLETLDQNSQSGADGMTVDRNGFLYVATKIGLQICDPAGRVQVILSKPHSGPLSNVVFGGHDLDTIYVTAGDRVYRRPSKQRGIWSWQPAKPPQPRL